MTPPPGKTPPEGQALSGFQTGPGVGRGNDHRTLVLLGALCLFLSTLEYLIPKPLPFIRIGLANLPLLLALDLLPPRRFALLCLIKVAGGGIIGGAIFSYGFLFSLGGSAASALVMYGLGLVRRKGPAALRPGLAGIGTAGALCSTGVQLLLARFLVFGEAARYLIPPFLAAALAAGFALGLFSESFCRRSRWYSLRAGGAVESAGGGGGFGDAEERSPGPPKGAVPVPRGGPETETPPGAAGRRRIARGTARQRRRSHWDSLFDRRDLAAAGFLAALLFLFNPSIVGRAAQFLFFWFCAWASGRKNRPLVTLLVIAGVVLVNLLSPYGRVLAAVGPFSVTMGSLAAGFRKGITLEGLFMLSAALIGNKPSFSTLVPPQTEPPYRAVRRPRPGVAGYIAVFGRFLGESLAVFAVLSEGGRHFRPGRLIEDLDSLLLELDETGMAKSSGAPGPGGIAPRHKPAGGRPLIALGLLVTAVFTLAPGLLNLAFEAVPKLQFLGDKPCLSSYLEFSGKTGL